MRQKRWGNEASYVYNTASRGGGGGRDIENRRVWSDFQQVSSAAASTHEDYNFSLSDLIGVITRYHHRPNEIGLAEQPRATRLFLFPVFHT